MLIHLGLYQFHLDGSGYVNLETWDFRFDVVDLYSVILMCYWCTAVVFLLFYCRISVMLLLYCHYILLYCCYIAIVLYGYCTYIVLMKCCFVMVRNGDNCYSRVLQWKMGHLEEDVQIRRG